MSFILPKHYPKDLGPSNKMNLDILRLFGKEKNSCLRIEDIGYKVYPMWRSNTILKREKYRNLSKGREVQCT